MHNLDIRASATQFGVYDYQPYCPICYGAEGNEQDEASEESCLTDCIRKPCVIKVEILILMLMMQRPFTDDACKYIE